MKAYLSIVLVSQLLLLNACSTGYFGSDPREQLGHEQEPRFNYTDATDFLACIGTKIDESDLPATDIVVSVLGDNTKPYDLPGLLATENTTMATLALDRMSTRKVTPVGSSGILEEREIFQLVGAFSEFNRTYHSMAAGVGARLGNYEFELSADNEWNHIALDLMLTRENRLVHGMSVSVAISVNGESADGDLTIDPSDTKSIAIAFGTNGKEGIHSAQRLLVEVSTGVLIAKLYEIDPADCIKNKYRKDRNVEESDIIETLSDKGKSPITSYLKEMKQLTGDEGVNEVVEAANDTVPVEEETIQQKINDANNDALSQDSSISLPPAHSGRAFDKQAPVTLNCWIHEQGVGFSKPYNWEFKWDGQCDGDGYANGYGTLILLIDGVEHYQYVGNLVRGFKQGPSYIRYKGQNAYKQNFRNGIPVVEGYQRDLRYDRNTGQLALPTAPEGDAREKPTLKYNID